MQNGEVELSEVAKKKIDNVSRSDVCFDFNGAHERPVSSEQPMRRIMLESDTRRRMHLGSTFLSHRVSEQRNILGTPAGLENPTYVTYVKKRAEKEKLIQAREERLAKRQAAMGRASAAEGPKKDSNDSSSNSAAPSSRRPAQVAPWLKGSIGEGPNLTNFSN